VRGYGHVKEHNAHAAQLREGELLAQLPAPAAQTDSTAPLAAA